MQKRTLGKTHLDVSVLGYGCAPAAFLKSEQKQTADMIGQLLDSGINLIDTATMYPGSEAFIGEHLSSRRDEFVLVSKVGGAKAEGTVGEPWSDQLITTSIDRALKLMKTDHVDVMLLHSCDLATLEADDALAALVKARDAGKIRFAGYSGDNEAAAFAAKLPDVAVIETSINIVDQVNIGQLLPTAKQNNVGIIVKRPIANAAWKDLSTQQGIYKNYAKEYTNRLQAMGLKPSDLGMEDWAEMAIRFTISFPEVTTAIIGTTKLDNAKKNIEAVGKGPLSAEQVQSIRDAFAKADGSDRWTGQT